MVKGSVPNLPLTQVTDDPMTALKVLTISGAYRVGDFVELDMERSKIMRSPNLIDTRNIHQV